MAMAFHSRKSWPNLLSECGLCNPRHGFHEFLAGEKDPQKITKQTKEELPQKGTKRGGGSNRESTLINANFGKNRDTNSTNFHEAERVRAGKAAGRKWHFSLLARLSTTNQGSSTSLSVGGGGVVAGASVRLNENRCKYFFVRD
jgi:hypothetical protein